MSQFPDEESCKLKFKATREDAGVTYRHCGGKDHYWQKTIWMIASHFFEQSQVLFINTSKLFLKSCKLLPETSKLFLKLSLLAQETR